MMKPRWNEIPKEQRPSIYRMASGLPNLLAGAQEALGPGIDGVEVGDPTAPQTPVSLVLFATGSLHGSIRATLEWLECASIPLGIRQVHLDDEEVLEAIVVLSEEPLPDDTSRAMAAALVGLETRLASLQEHGSDLEGQAVDLLAAAEHVLGMARRCSDLADLDERCWVLARLLRRHASEVHARLPDQHERARQHRLAAAILTEPSVELRDPFGLVILEDHSSLAQLLFPPLCEEIIGRQASTTSAIETNGRFLQEAERLLGVLCEESQQRTDRALNTVMYWLGLVTLGLGAITLWDKYQTHHDLGLSLAVAAGIAATLATALALLFLLAAYRNGLLWPGVRRTVARLTAPLRRQARWRWEVARLRWAGVVPPRVHPEWWRWFSTERTLLQQGVLAAVSSRLEEDAHDPVAAELLVEAEERLVLLWYSAVMRAWTHEQRDRPTHVPGTSWMMDQLWADALGPAAVRSLWLGLPRPIPPELWSAMLLLGRSEAAPWAFGWHWSDVAGGDDRAGRAPVRDAVCRVVSEGWLAAQDAPCPLDPHELWSLIAGLDEEDLPASVDDGDWESRLHEAIDTLGGIEDILNRLREALHHADDA